MKKMDGLMQLLQQAPSEEMILAHMKTDLIDMGATMITLDTHIHVRFGENLSVSKDANKIATHLQSANKVLFYVNHPQWNKTEEGLRRGNDVENLFAWIEPNLEFDPNFTLEQEILNFRSGNGLNHQPPHKLAYPFNQRKFSYSVCFTDFAKEQFGYLLNQKINRYHHVQTFGYLNEMMKKISVIHDELCEYGDHKNKTMCIAKKALKRLDEM
jgi:hypothetical protein